MTNANELQVVVGADGRFRIGVRNAKSTPGFFTSLARGELERRQPAGEKAASDGWAVDSLDVHDVAHLDVSCEVEALLEVAAELVAAALAKLNGG